MSTPAAPPRPKEPGSSTPRVSVVIPTYNDREHLRACLESVLRQNPPSSSIEVIVVDDGSTDGTAAMVRERFPEVRLLTRTNEGAELARNAGVDAATGQLIAFIDSDCVATPHWLETLDRRLRNDPKLVLGGRILHRGDFWQRLTGIADFGEYQGLLPREVATLPSCNMGLHRTLFQTQRFDPRFRPNADTLFAEGLRRRGATLLYDPEFMVIHNPPAGPADFFSRGRRYGRSFVVARKVDPDLRWAGFVRAGVPGVTAATLGRTFLDWSRLLRHRRATAFGWMEVLPALALLALRRIASLPEAIRAVLERPPRS